MDCKEFSQVDWERVCPSRIWDRGRVYYYEGALIAACKFEGMLAGVFIGSGMTYQARIWLEAGAPHWECNCPYPEFCKHLAAVVFAWQQQPGLFEEISPRFERVRSQADGGSEIFKQLVFKNPFDFIRFTQGPPQRDGFLNRRELVNVVRNLFQRPLVNLSEAENLWERVQGVGQLLRSQLGAGEEHALEALRVLWEKIVESYHQTPFALLKQLLVEVLELIKGVAHSFEYATAAVFWDILYRQSVTPGLWEIGPELRQVLQKLVLVHPQLLGRVPENILDSGYLQWAAHYELGMILPQTPETRMFMERIGEKLRASVTGRLRLIDRLLDKDPDEALRLAKQGMAAGEGTDKQAFRERMITIHQGRRQFKQGAALAFLQFQATPSFDEYLRLKHLLRDFPQIFDGYYLRIGPLLMEKGAYPLLVRIMAAEEDLDRLNRTIETLLRRPDLLLEALDGLSTGIFPAMLDVPVYQEIALALLEDGRRAMVKGARRWIVNYQKGCLRFDRLERWQELLTRIKTDFGMNTAICRQLGKVIAE